MSGQSRPAPLAKGSFHRTQRLIDPRWQMGVACAASLMLLATGALYLFGSSILSSPRITQWFGASAMPMVKLVGDVGFFVGVVALVHFVVVRMTHSVVGPALVVERGLNAIRDGRFDARFSLRDGDYLLPVAESANALNEHLAKQVKDMDAALAELRAAAGEDSDICAAIDSIEAVMHGSTDGAQGADSQETGAQETGAKETAA